MLKNLKLHDIVYISDNSSQKIEHFVQAIDRFISYDMIKIVDAGDYMSHIIINNNDEVGLYFLVDEFPQGSSRQEILEKDIKWLFEPPLDGHPKDLEFAQTIGDNFYCKKFPTLKDESCSITEYFSPQNIKYKEVILLEVGCSLYLYHGYILKEDEIIYND